MLCQLRQPTDWMQMNADALLEFFLFTVPEVFLSRITSVRTLAVLGPHHVLGPQKVGPSKPRCARIRHYFVSSAKWRQRYERGTAEEVRQGCQLQPQAHPQGGQEHRKVLPAPAATSKMDT